MFAGIKTEGGVVPIRNRHNYKTPALDGVSPLRAMRKIYNTLFQLMAVN